MEFRLSLHCLESIDPFPCAAQIVRGTKSGKCGDDLLCLGIVGESADWLQTSETQHPMLPHDSLRKSACRGCMFNEPSRADSYCQRDPHPGQYIIRGDGEVFPRSSHPSIDKNKTNESGEHRKPPSGPS